MSNTVDTSNYSTKLNWADRIYAAQKSYNGAASAQAVRAETPATGISRVWQATRLGVYNGYSAGNGAVNKINSPLVRNALVTAGLGAAAHAVPQLPSSIFLPYVGNIASLGGSLGLTALVGTGSVGTYNPATDKSSVSWVPKAIARYGLVGFVTELPLRSLSASKNSAVANTAAVLACGARFVLEIPRAALAGVAAALFTLIPSVAGGTLGGVVNFFHALISSKPAADLAASGSVTSATAPASTSTPAAPLVEEPAPAAA